MLKSNWIRVGLNIIKISIIIIVLLIYVMLLTKKDIELEVNEVNYVVGVLYNDEIEYEEEIEDNNYVSKDVLVGDLTGYAADCPLCNGTLGCLPSYKVYKNGVLDYNDNTYGNVRIVASSKNLPCGSIIRFNSDMVSDDDTIAIVLDRGVLGNDIDLLVESEEYAYLYIGRSVISYDILRYGW